MEGRLETRRKEEEEEEDWKRQALCISANWLFFITFIITAKSSCILSILYTVGNGRESENGVIICLWCVIGPVCKVCVCVLKCCEKFKYII